LHATLIVQGLEPNSKAPEPSDVTQHLVDGLPERAAIVAEMPQGE
jgi:hypothetical protein